ncbi:IstB ATP binding domain-containing protein, partial [mine drainage metagenome]
FADYLEAAKRDNWSHGHLLAEVLRAELDLRDTRRSGRLLTEAKIPRAKLLSEFDLALSAISEETLGYLARGDFVGDATSVVMIGGPGTGKSHLLIGTLIALVALGKRVRYINAAALVNELAEAEDERRLQKLLERYARFEVLAIDELGYLHLDRRGAELLFQVITDREEASSLMIATNLPFGEWPISLPIPAGS